MERTTPGDRIPFPATLPLPPAPGEEDPRVPAYVEVQVEAGALGEFRAVERGERPWDLATFFPLALLVHVLEAKPEFDRLYAPDLLPHLDLFPHQREVLRRAVWEMGGRALLADEVGLGKTIEAGLILVEYLSRGLAEQILVLVPASLALQWQRELAEKFSLYFPIATKPHTLEREPRFIASLDLAKRSPYREILFGRTFDLVVVDEAHKLKNPKTLAYRLVAALRKTFLLLLTATPLHNHPRELAALVRLLRPGHEISAELERAANRRGKRETRLLSAGRPTTGESVGEETPPLPERARPSAGGETANSAAPPAVSEVRERLHEVMIRSRRREVGIELPPRRVVTVPIHLSREEREFYEAVSAFIRREYARRGKSSALPLILMQRQLTSSRVAVYTSLLRLYRKHPEDPALQEEILSLYEMGRSIPHDYKQDALIALLRGMPEDEKVVVFSEFHGSVHALVKRLRGEGIPAVLYRGGFGRSKKDYMRELFATRARVLAATEAGAEGLNLQCARHVVNYDLPWNPMRLEQRIGRVHRLGQTQPVQVYNLVTQDTVEAEVLAVLYEKLGAIQALLGLDEDVLGRGGGARFERHLFDILVGSRSARERSVRLEHLAALLEQLTERGGDAQAGRSS
ncbi:MAG: Superfamily II DNA/RNA helicase [Brockia lithotrophica]|uniref:Superfamily II DNA/RNA helicase n=1 Tax=Brockia lithotrophica TaxID=933949 RepID=A0A2T5G6A4_9BACL|nr:DEAD/DEAH box helicase [Brockia lithotrophica]PTQ51709.1 MAG: Superfamily II DNA/RNA helicase [Brockia lithotrophica]